MDSKIEPLPNDISAWNGLEVDEAIAIRKKRMKTLFDECGPGFKNATEEIAIEVKRLGDEVEVLGSQLFMGSTGMRMQHPRPPGGYASESSGTAAAARGWKAGHWARPFMREQKALTPSGSITVPSLTGGIIEARQPARLLDVVPTQQLRGTDQFSFLRETARTHNAAPVADSGTAYATKPTSVYDVARVDDRVSTIAHLAGPVRRQTLADAALLEGYLEGALREGIQLALEDQICNGDGTGAELLGLLETPNVNTSVIWSTDILETTRKAITALEDVYLQGTFVFSSADWEMIELLQSADGPYILPDNLPADRAARRLWGRPVITTTVLPAETGLLVDFASSTLLWEREGIQIDWSEAVPVEVGGATGFETNTLKFRAEGRFGFAVLRPAGVIVIPTAA